MTEQIINIDAITEALNTGLSTNVYMIYVPSLGRDVAFKPLLTGQAKTLAKLMISANEKPLDTFKAVCGMIKATCMEEDLDINNLNELDRFRIMLDFYTSNNILKDFDAKCPECKTSNRININLEGIVAAMDSISCDVTEFTNDQVNRLDCIIEIPKLTTMYRFYELLQDKKVEEDDIIKCFISSLKLSFEVEAVDDIDISIDGDLESYFAAIELIPMVIMSHEQTQESVFDIVMDKLDSIMVTDDKKQECTKCGHDLGEVASARNFI